MCGSCGEAARAFGQPAALPEAPAGRSNPPDGDLRGLCGTISMKGLRRGTFGTGARHPVKTRRSDRRGRRAGTVDGAAAGSSSGPASRSRHAAEGGDGGPRSPVVRILSPAVRFLRRRVGRTKTSPPTETRRQRQNDADGAAETGTERGAREAGGRQAGVRQGQEQRDPRVETTQDRGLGTRASEPGAGTSRRRLCTRAQPEPFQGSLSVLSGFFRGLVNASATAGAWLHLTLLSFTVRMDECCRRVSGGSASAPTHLRLRPVLIPPSRSWPPPPDPLPTVA